VLLVAKGADEARLGYVLEDKEENLIEKWKASRTR